MPSDSSPSSHSEPGAPDTPGASDAHGTDEISDASTLNSPSVPETIGLEPAEEDRDKPAEDSKPVSVKSLDVCPHCGADWPNTSSIVCMRCGYDLKQLKIVQPDTSESDSTTEDDEDEATETEPISQVGRGEMWLPAGIAAIGLIIMLVGYLAGAHGLFPGLADEQTVTWGLKFQSLARFAVRASIWIAAACGSILVLAKLNERSVGELRLTLSRLAAIILAMSMVAFLDFPSSGLEQFTELVLQAGLFLGLSLALFHITIRDAAILVMLLVVFRFGVLLAAMAVMWAG